jgi:hypothetical protein
MEATGPQRIEIMKVSLTVIVLLVPLTLCGSAISQFKHLQLPEQTHFSAENESVQKPVPLPEDVLVILKQDEMVRNALEDENVPADKLPSTWFSASVVHLSSPEKEDLIVVGEPPLSGANIVTFWIFCASPHGYELVLTAAAHDLIVRKKRWNGHLEIEMLAATAVEVSSVLFRWDGKRYAEYREKSEDIK